MVLRWYGVKIRLRGKMTSFLTLLFPCWVGREVVKPESKATSSSVNHRRLAGAMSVEFHVAYNKLNSNPHHETVVDGGILEGDTVTLQPGKLPFKRWRKMSKWRVWSLIRLLDTLFGRYIISSRTSGHPPWCHDNGTVMRRYLLFDAVCAYFVLQCLRTQMA
jgi:hypothetical protein